MAGGAARSFWNCSVSVALLSAAYGPFIPLNHERLATFERRPGGVGDDGDARHQLRGIVEALDLDDLDGRQGP